MLVSVVMTNYNYEQFLVQAIDSCLSQSYAQVEIVVVDDGSTDGSREIIDGYGDSVIAVLNENGGQAAAVNAGFAASHGDLVCLLDSDDAFTRDKVSAVVEAWARQPEASLVYHQLQTIDAEGVPSGSPWPSRVWNGDISHKLARTSGWWPRPTTTGLCFARPFLERVMPIPEGRRTFPDPYLAPPAAMVGPVVGIREPLGLYRIHGRSSQDTLFRPGEGQGRRSAALRSVEQMEYEHERFVTCMEGLGDSSDRFDVHGNPEYVAARWRAGLPVSVAEYFRAWVACPAIPHAMRPRLYAKAVEEYLRASR